MKQIHHKSPMKKLIKEAYSTINKPPKQKRIWPKKDNKKSAQRLIPSKHFSITISQKSATLHSKPLVSCDKVLSDRSKALTGFSETQRNEMTLGDNNNNRDEVMLNSQSTRDQKSVSNQHIKVKKIELDFLNEDLQALEKFEESESCIIESNQHNRKASACPESVKCSSPHPSKQKGESETSYFLNYNLCDSKNFTSFEDISLFDKKEITILTHGGSKLNILPIIDETEKFEISDFPLSDLNKEDDDLDLSTITAKRLSCVANVFANTKQESISAAMQIINKKMGNISILSGDSLELFEFNRNQQWQGNSNSSNYCLDTNEFATNQENRNIVYTSQVQENFLKSHLDVVNLSFLLRYIFHKHAKKSTRNKYNNKLNTEIHDNSKEYLHEVCKATIQELSHGKCTKTKEEEGTLVVNPIEKKGTAATASQSFPKMSSNLIIGHKPKLSNTRGAFVKFVAPHNTPKANK